MNTKLERFLITFFVTLGLVAIYLFIKKYGFGTILALYKNFDATTLTAYCVTILILFIVLTWRWDVILRSRGHHVAFHRLFVYRIIGSAINFSHLVRELAVNQHKQHFLARMALNLKKVSRQS